MSKGIVIAGGSGFLGRPLASLLAGAGYTVTILSRTPPGAVTSRDGIAYAAWTPDGSVGAWREVIEGTGAVVNLAGESIAARRWSSAQKTRLVESRLGATRSLVSAVHEATVPPPVFVSASAIGYYGDRGTETLTEQSPPGQDFLATLAAQWEHEADRAAGSSTRVVHVRTGIVLDPAGGALKSLLLPFRLFAGGPLGTGRQYMSWIHIGDWLDLVRWAIETPGVTGPLNATAPHPVTNREFSRTLGRVLGRPSLIPTPGFALKLALGEMAGPLLLASQKVLPVRAEELGFDFSHESLEPALRNLLT